MSDLDIIGCLTVQVDDLNKENTNLKAEVERLETFGADATLDNRILEADNAFLKAEVERLQNNCDYLDRELDREIEKTAMLCGQVERLRKAGDELLHEWSSGDETNGRNFMKGLVIWNVAKEGKQP